MSLTFRPIEANLTHNTDLIGRMNPYCVFLVGTEKYKTEICRKGGKHPAWADVVTVPFMSNLSSVPVELWDKDRITHDDIIGTTTIDLREIQTLGKNSRWYPLFYKNKPAGEILIETSLTGVGLKGTGMTTTSAVTSTMTEGMAPTTTGGILPGGLTSGKMASTTTNLPAGLQTFIFRPIEARLTHKTDLIMKMSPYVAFVVGNERILGPVCPKGNKTPVWQTEVAVPLVNNASVMLVEVMDKDKITSDDLIGSCTIDLTQLQATGGLHQWYPLTYKGKPAGELLLESFIYGSKYASSAYGTGVYGTAFNYLPGKVYVGNELFEGAWTFDHQTDFFNRYRTESSQSRFYTEQRQFVENRTFLREVDVVETVPVQRQIEVLEAHKVMKEVQYTQAVPVTKQIEIVEPVVVQRQVEVIEPKVVIKEIQVIENVPVTKMVDVVEMRSRVQNVETVEPQTFTKQVAVTEHVPVMKNVTVTEPVTVKKAVEFVEPVITTQTIYKEIAQPVIVDQRTTVEVGPATLVGIYTDIHKEFAHLSLAEREKLILKQKQMRLTSGWTESQVNVQTGPTYERSTYTETTTQVLPGTKTIPGGNLPPA